MAGEISGPRSRSGRAAACGPVRSVPLERRVPFTGCGQGYKCVGPVSSDNATLGTRNHSHADLAAGRIAGTGPGASDHDAGESCEVGTGWSRAHVSLVER